MVCGCGQLSGPTFQWQEPSIVFTHPRTLAEHRAFAANPWLGWRHQINIDFLDKQFVPGDHLSMVNGDNARLLADFIESRISGT